MDPITLSSSILHQTQIPFGVALACASFSFIWLHRRLFLSHFLSQTNMRSALQQVCNGPEIIELQPSQKLQKFFGPSSSSSLGQFHPYFAVVGGKGAAIQRRYKCEISFGNASFIVPGSEMDVNVAKDNLSPSLPSHSPVNYISDVSGLDPAGLNSLTTADSPYIFFQKSWLGWSVLWHLAIPVTKKRIEVQRRAERTPLKCFFFDLLSRGLLCPRLPLRLLYTTQNLLLAPT